MNNMHNPHCCPWGILTLFIWGAFKYLRCGVGNTTHRLYGSISTNRTFALPSSLLGAVRWPYLPKRKNITADRVGGESTGNASVSAHACGRCRGMGMPGIPQTHSKYIARGRTVGPRPPIWIPKIPHFRVANKATANTDGIRVFAGRYITLIWPRVMTGSLRMWSC